MKLLHFAFSQLFLQRKQTRPLPCSAGDQVLETMAPRGITQYAVHHRVYFQLLQFPILIHAPSPSITSPIWTIELLSASVHQVAALMNLVLLHLHGLVTDFIPKYLLYYMYFDGKIGDWFRDNLRILIKTVCYHQDS